MGARGRSWTGSRCCRWRSGRGRGHLLHSDRRQGRDHRRAHGRDEGRRDPGELRALHVEMRSRAALARDRRRARRASSSRSFKPRGRPRLFLIADGRSSTSPRRGPPRPGDGHVLREPGALGGVRVENAAARAEGLPVPEEIDREIARLKLETMGVTIDGSPRSRPSTSPRGTRGPSPLCSMPTPVQLELRAGGDRARAQLARRRPGDGGDDRGGGPAAGRDTRERLVGRARADGRGGLPGVGPGYDQPSNPVIRLEESVVPALLRSRRPGGRSMPPAAPVAHTRRLVELGHDVVGVDETEAMLVPGADARCPALTCGSARWPSSRSRTPRSTLQCARSRSRMSPSWALQSPSSAGPAAGWPRRRQRRAPDLRRAR
jgi:hypothetical protein